MQPRRRAPAARWFALAALVLIAAGCTPQSATEEGRAVYGLYNLFMYIAAVVFVSVGLSFVVIPTSARRRLPTRPRQHPPRAHLDLIPLYRLVLFVLTMQAQNRCRPVQQGRRHITVTAFHWSVASLRGHGAEVLLSPGRPPIWRPFGRPSDQADLAEWCILLLAPDPVSAPGHPPPLTSSPHLREDRAVPRPCTQSAAPPVMCTVRVVTPASTRAVAAATRRGAPATGTEGATGNTCYHRAPLPRSPRPTTSPAAHRRLPTTATTRIGLLYIFTAFAVFLPSGCWPLLVRWSGLPGSMSGENTTNRVHHHVTL